MYIYYTSYTFHGFPGDSLLQPFRVATPAKPAERKRPGRLPSPRYSYH